MVVISSPRSFQRVWFPSLPLSIGFQNQERPKVPPSTCSILRRSLTQFKRYVAKNAVTKRDPEETFHIEIDLTPHQTIVEFRVLEGYQKHVIPTRVWFPTSHEGEAFCIGHGLESQHITVQFQAPGAYEKYFFQARDFKLPPRRSK